jgi:phospholipase A1
MRTESAGGALAALLTLSACAASAQALDGRLEDCAVIAADRERLQCYDRLAASSMEAGRAAANEPQSPAPAHAETAAPAGERDTSRLAEHWELTTARKRGSFGFRPHEENYLIATYNSAPNNAPYRPFRSLTPGAQGLSHAELAFQLGFKMKLAENPFDAPVDLWFGYTQRSFWQAANHRASSPFRETDYQPELMAVIPVDVRLPGLRMRFVNLGLLHQSNGQGSTLSRSWNRAYVQAGFERGDFTLLARAWKRFDEARETDDNPDIVDYMGRGDLVASYRWRGQEFSLMARHNFHTGKGATQLGWHFPLAKRLNGYVQLFSGYGYTLIDYNVYQRVLGVGLSITY